MATIGVKDLFIAKCTENAAGETFGTPRRLAKTIKVEMTTNIAEAILHADDSIDKNVKVFVSGVLKLDINDLADEDVAELLGQETDEDGVIYGGGDDIAPYWAVGFRADKGDGTFVYVWLYKTKFSIPDESYETKKEGITFQTPKLEGTFQKRDSDGRWRARKTLAPTDAVAVTWFEKVREFKAA